MNSSVWVIVLLLGVIVGALGVQEHDALKANDCGVNCDENSQLDNVEAKSDITEDPTQFKVINPEEALQGFEGWHRGFKRRSGVYGSRSANNLSPDEEYEKTPVDISQLTHTPKYIRTRESENLNTDVDEALNGFDEWHKQFWHKTMVETLNTHQAPPQNRAPAQVQSTAAPSPVNSNQVTICNSKVCPHPNAVCCEGVEYCCPQGYKCANQQAEQNSTSGYVPPCVVDENASVGKQFQIKISSPSSSTTPSSLSSNAAAAAGVSSAVADQQPVHPATVVMPGIKVNDCCGQENCASCPKPKPGQTALGNPQDQVLQGQDGRDIVVHIRPKIVYEEAPVVDKKDAEEPEPEESKSGSDDPSADSEAGEEDESEESSDASSAESSMEAESGDAEGESTEDSSSTDAAANDSGESTEGDESTTASATEDGTENTESGSEDTTTAPSF